MSKMHHNCVGVYDYSVGPFALGDAITWIENLCVLAAQHECERIIQYHVADPSLRFSQGGFANENNFREHFVNLFPVFLCANLPVEINWISDRWVFDDRLLRSELPGCGCMFPSRKDYLAGFLDFSYNRSINDYYEVRGDIPRLRAPCCFENSVDDFFAKYCRGKFVVSVNIRQRKLYPGSAAEGSASFLRDSPLGEWYRFFDLVADRYPEVIFIVLGGYNEWERDLFGRKNVLIPRSFGFNLAHELCLFHKSNLFMGTSSGFAVMAFFSSIPYVVTNLERKAADYLLVPWGSEKLPFALECQRLSWVVETADLLLDLFKEVYLA